MPLGSSPCKSENGQTGRRWPMDKMVGHRGSGSDLGSSSRCHYSYGPHIALACSCGPIMMIQMLMECIVMPLLGPHHASLKMARLADSGPWIMVGHRGSDLDCRVALTHLCLASLDSLFHLPLGISFIVLTYCCTIADVEWESGERTWLGSQSGRYSVSIVNHSS